VIVGGKGFTYEAFRLIGWHHGEGVRRQFKRREEASGEKNRLEVEAANAESGTRAINTRLTVKRSERGKPRLRA
jgi:hypothetical protein